MLTVNLGHGSLLLGKERPASACVERLSALSLVPPSDSLLLQCQRPNLTKQYSSCRSALFRLWGPVLLSWFVSPPLTHANDSGDLPKDGPVKPSQNDKLMVSHTQCVSVPLSLSVSRHLLRGDGGSPVWQWLLLLQTWEGNLPTLTTSTQHRPQRGSRTPRQERAMTRPRSTL